MPRTDLQKLGDLGEDFALKSLNIKGCMNCNHSRGRIKKLVGSFAAVDLICEFCFQAYQVKTTAQIETNSLPNTIRGAQYPPLEDRKSAGLYHPLVIVLLKKGRGGPCGLTRQWRKTATIWYLSAKFVKHHFDELFRPYHTTIKQGKEKGRQLIMNTIILSDEIKADFVEIV